MDAWTCAGGMRPREVGLSRAHPGLAKGGSGPYTPRRWVTIVVLGVASALPRTTSFAQVVEEIQRRAAESGREMPVPRVSAAELAAQEREEARRVGSRLGQGEGMGR